MSNYVIEVMDRLVPPFEDERGDWARVLADAGADESVARTPWPLDTTATATGRDRYRRSRGRRLTRRRLVVIAITVVAIATPLIAAASENWGFLWFAGSAPEPITDVSVVKTGEWDGKSWQLVAYLTATDGVCFALTPTATNGATGEGGALNCAQIEGVPRTELSKPYTPLTITFLAGSSLGVPAFVVGAVIDSADEVAIYLASGQVIRTPTFDAPDDLGSIRFYATQVPEPIRSPGERPDIGVKKLVGFGDDGEIVACLVFPEGAVPLSACR